MLHGLQKKTRHILQLIGYTEEPDITIVSKYYRNGTLSKRIFSKRVQLTTEFILKAVKGIATGMRIVHECQIVHYDLKPANVLLDEEDEAVISDLGVANLIGKDKLENPRLVAGFSVPSIFGLTPTHASPELFTQQNRDTIEADKKVDVYAFGVMVWEMLHRKPPWLLDDGHHMPPFLIQSLVRQGERPQIAADVREQNPHLVQIMENCWAQDPAVRPTFNEVLERLDRIEVPKVPPQPGQ